jgi:hypothetical protein
MTDFVVSSIGQLLGLAVTVWTREASLPEANVPPSKTIFLTVH